MSIFQAVKRLFNKKTTREQIIALYEKERDEFTARGEDYVKIVDLTPDDQDVASGEYTYIWNDIFIVRLIRSGYQFKSTDTDADMIDRWHVAVSQNCAKEVYEQYLADPKNRGRQPTASNINSNYTEHS